MDTIMIPQSLLLSVQMVEAKVGVQLTHLKIVILLLQDENKGPELRSYQPHETENVYKNVV
jgi:hypothetical protein